MGQEIEGNGRTLAVLCSEMHNVSVMIDKMCREWQVDHDQIRTNTVHLTMLESRAPMVCPKHDQLVAEIQKIQVEIARTGMTSGASGGVMVSVIAGVVFGVGKAAGWW
jgi:hypothetical protein